MLIIGFSHSESETVTFNATLRAAGNRVKSYSLHTLFKQEESIPSVNFSPTASLVTAIS